MSTRAIRALRGDTARLVPSNTAAVTEEEEDDDTDEEEEINTPRRPAVAFTMLNNEDDDDDDDDNDDEEECEEKDDMDGERGYEGNKKEDEDRNQLNHTRGLSSSDRKQQQPSVKSKRGHQHHTERESNHHDSDNYIDNDDDNTEKEDIDALVSEFQEKDLMEEAGDFDDDDDDDDTTKKLSSTNTTTTNTTLLDIIVTNIDIRDFDYQYTMRTSILQWNHDNEPPQSRGAGGTLNTGGRPHYHLFGPPMDGWIRPPRYVGGGMGMFSYDDRHINGSSTSRRRGGDDDDNDATIVPPWPYHHPHDPDVSSASFSWPTIRFNPKRWCTFQRADQAKRDVQDYFSIQQNNGDINMLIMFIAHHPYVPEALLQLSNVLYQTNHTAEGYAMLRRCLYVFETSFHINFINHIIVLQERTYLMDMYHRNENRIFFQALFRYIQISHIAGLNRTALATCRLLLSFDPLRDPMNVLLALDYHAIMVSRRYGYRDQIHLLRWLIQLVDDNIIPIWFQDKNIASNPKTYCGTLLDLPNWSYSYALALFDLQKAMQCVESEDGNDAVRIEEVKVKADTAIQKAMSQYPSVIGYLLHNLEIDTTGRSFQRDWITVLDHATAKARELIRHWYNITDDTIVLSATIKACDLISKIFAELNAKLYGDDDVLQWLYDNLVILKARESGATNDTWINIPVPSPAILRYANVDPNDYSTKVQTMPPDANIIDNGLLAHAMIIDPRRPRYLRRNQRQQNQHDGDDLDNIQYDELGNPFLPQQRAATAYFGPPTEVIDPDWPMAEVFLRSILPWNYVDGLPPPRR